MTWKAAVPLLTLAAAGFLLAQEPAPVEPDTLLFVNGEKLIGHLVTSNGSSVVFKSDSAGEVTVDWSKIQDLRTSDKFAVLPKNARVRNKEEAAQVPKGTLAVREQNVTVNEGAPEARTLPVASTEHLVKAEAFEKAVLRSPGFFELWRGAFTAGASIVQATQKSQIFNGAVTLTRAVPVEGWLDRRHNTVINFNGSRGFLRQPNSPELKTEIYHGDLEHDRYFTTRLYIFEQATFDRNYSQGLDLAQVYGAGLGWTVVRRETQELDLKATVSYVKQQFQDGLQNQNLIGSIFSERTLTKFGKKRDILLAQQITATPTWNNLNAYGATGTVTLTLPIYRRMAFTLGLVEAFVNNPSPGFRKNSLQGTTGLTFTLP